MDRFVDGLIDRLEASVQALETAEGNATRELPLPPGGDGGHAGGGRQVVRGKSRQRAPLQPRKGSPDGRGSRAPGGRRDRLPIDVHGRHPPDLAAHGCGVRARHEVPSQGGLRDPWHYRRGSPVGVPGIRGHARSQRRRKGTSLRRGQQRDGKILEEHVPPRLPSSHDGTAPGKWQRGQTSS